MGTRKRPGKVRALYSLQESPGCSLLPGVLFPGWLLSWDGGEPEGGLSTNTPVVHMSYLQMKMKNKTVHRAIKKHLEASRSSKLGINPNKKVDEVCNKEPGKN